MKVHSNKAKARKLSNWLLPPANEVCGGNVFTGICLFTGGGGLSLCPDGVSAHGGLCPGGVSVRGGICQQGLCSGGGSVTETPP